MVNEWKVTCGNGTTYVVTSEEAKNALEGVKNKSQTEIDNIVKQYASEITKEDDLQEFDEEPVTQIGSQAAENGYNYEEYSAYKNSIGMSSLTEDSSVDDFIAVFKNIEKQINEFQNVMRDKSYTNDPDKIDALLTSMANSTNALNELGDSLELNLPTSNNGWKIAGGVAGAAGIGIGVATGAIATTSLTIAGASLSVPGPGWVIAGVCAVVAIGAGLVGLFQNHEAEKKMEQLKEDMMAASEKLKGEWDVVEQNIQNNGKTVVKDATKALDGLLNDKFDFKDITDVNSVSKNINKIMEQQGILEPWYNMSQKWGIKVEGLDKVMDKLGSGDNRLQYAQKYFDDYIDQVDLGLQDEVVKDTESLNKLWADLTQLGEEMEKKGIDITKLRDLRTEIAKKNQEEADQTAQDIINGVGGGSVGSSGGYGDGSVGGGTVGGTGGGAGYVQDANNAANAANTAQETSIGVQDGSTSYDTSTQQLDDAETQLREAAQKAVDDYLGSISTAGKDIAQLEELYKELESTKEAFGEVKTELDLSAFPSKMQEVRDAQQAQVDEFLNNINTSGKSIAELEELYGLVGAKKTEIEGITSALNLSGFDTKQQDIRTAQQTVADEFINSVSASGESIGELQNVYNQVSGAQQEILGITTALDLNAYTTKLQEIRAAQQGLIDDYVNNFATDGKSIEELEQLYGEVGQIQININGLTGELDTSGLTTCMESIKAAQQTIVNEYAATAQGLVEGAATTTERKALIAQLQEYSATYQQFGLDLSAVDNCVESVLLAQQTYINEITIQYTQEATDATTKEAAEAVLGKVNVEINDCGGMGCDVSGLIQLAATLGEKIAGFKDDEGGDEEGEGEESGTPTGTETGETPGNTDVGETPGNTEDGETPGNTNAGETPGNTDAGETPSSTEDGGVPGNTDAGETPGNTEDGGVPGNTDVGETPGNTDAGETPSSTEDGGVPGNTDAGETPGNTEDGGVPGNTDAGETTVGTGEDNAPPADDEGPRHDIGTGSPDNGESTPDATSEGCGTEEDLPVDMGSTEVATAEPEEKFEEEIPEGEDIIIVTEEDEI